jgi:anti-sigma regulatory factor (Ser/Thr protein kinase)
MLPAIAAADLLMDLPRSNTAAGIGRRALRRMLDGCYALDLARDAELAVSELITNAVSSTTGAVHLAARFDDDTGVLRAEVSDADPRAFTRGAYAQSALGGAGLTIVTAVTTSSGVSASPTGEGKMLWFEIHQYRPAGRLIA